MEDPAAVAPQRRPLKNRHPTIARTASHTSPDKHIEQAVNNPEKFSRTWLYIAAIAAVCTAVFAYTFKPTLDMNGDTSQYYIYATSLAQGEGYTELGTPGHPPTSAFPPGYPLLMAPLRALTPSIVAQKILNGVMLFGAAMLLFLFLRRVVPQPLALTAVLVALLNYRVLQFATIMMSETAYLLFSALAVWLLYRFDTDTSPKWWKRPWFYLLVLAAGYGYMIRTQGITLPAGIVVWMLCVRKWRQALAFAAGFAVTTLPWTLRNHLVGLGPSRYLDQLLAVNIWQPDAGRVSFGGLIERGVDTLRMLVTKAIPNTVTPYLDVDYEAAATFGEWVAGAALIAVILFGFWRIKRYFWFFTAYSAAVVGIICLWSAPSGNRYITTLVPLLEIGLTIGIYALTDTVLRRRFQLRRTFSPLWLLIPAVLLAGGRIREVAAESRQPLPPQFSGFIDAARAVRKQLPPETVVCSRKPSVFYVYAGCHVCNFRYTADDEQLIRGLVDSRVDYVLLDQLGYAATWHYLYPAIQKHPELFGVAAAFGNPQTFLLRFDRTAAELKLRSE